jgi:hypothetical protein
VCGCQRRQPRARPARSVAPAFRRYQELTARHPDVRDRRRASGRRRLDRRGTGRGGPSRSGRKSRWCSSPAPSARCQAADEPQNESAASRQTQATEYRSGAPLPRARSGSHQDAEVLGSTDAGRR